MSRLLPRAMLRLGSDDAPLASSSLSSSSSSVSLNSSPISLSSFTLLQMNLLADTLCSPTSFPHTDPAVLTWSHRHELLLDEILGRNHRQPTPTTATPKFNTNNTNNTGNTNLSITNSSTSAHTSSTSQIGTHHQNHAGRSLTQPVDAGLSAIQTTTGNASSTAPLAGHPLTAAFTRLDLNSCSNL